MPPGPRPPPATGPPTPTTASAPTRIGKTGTVTLRHAASSTTSASAGPTPGTHILLLIQDLHVRIIDAATGELLRELTLDPARNYQPTGRPPGPTQPPNANTPTLTWVRGVLDVLRDHMARLAGFEPATGCLEGSCSVLLSYRRRVCNFARPRSRGGNGADEPWSHSRAGAARHRCGLPIVLSVTATVRRSRAADPRRRSQGWPVAVGILAGAAADALLGDPRRGHPVALFGRAAQAAQSRAYADSRAARRRLRGRLPAGRGGAGASPPSG